MRQLKKTVKIGNIAIGGNNPIAVQTMLNVPTVSYTHLDVYKRQVLLKVSGEALSGEKGVGFDEATIASICAGTVSYTHLRDAGRPGGCLVQGRLSGAAAGRASGGAGGHPPRHQTV